LNSIFVSYLHQVVIQSNYPNHVESTNQISSDDGYAIFSSVERREFQSVNHGFSARCIIHYASFQVSAKTSFYFACFEIVSFVHIAFGFLLLIIGSHALKYSSTVWCYSWSGGGDGAPPRTFVSPSAASSFVLTS
jgi:hypothetical protein